jgi:hypothetical protein
MLDLMNKMTQLSEAKEKTKTGLKHTAEPGGYGRKDDEDDEGHKVKAAAVKKGKGRPKKDADDSGETKKYDFSAFGVKSGKDVKLPKHDKKKTTVVKGKSQSHADNKKDDGTDPDTKAKKKGLKEYFDALDRAIMNEAEQIQIKPLSQMPKQPGQQMAGQKPTMPGQQQTTGQSQQNTQVIQQGNRTLGTVKNPALAAQIKKELEGGGMTLMPEGEMDEGRLDELGNTDGGRKALRAVQKRGGDEITAWNKKPESGYSPTPTNAAKHFDASVSAGNRLYGHGPNTLRKDTVLARDAMRRYHKGEPITPEEVKIISKWYPGFKTEQQGKIREADQPPNDSLMSPMSEARAKADNKAEKTGKKVAKDIEYDEGHKSKDDNKAEKAGKKVTKDIEYDEKKKLPSMAHIKKMCQDGKSVAEICKMHPDCDQKELKQMVADCKETLDEASMPMKKVNGKSVPAFAADGKGKNDLTKKKVKEGMDHRLKAARHMGKAHALTKEGYNCRYDDMEESRHYHEGYKEGLDECYGQMPIQGYVGEANNEVADMASYGAHTPTMEDDLDEMDKTSYMKQQAIKTPGNTFKAFGQTFKDKEVVESPFAFEAWEKELNSILEGKDVTEGMTVSISKGQQGSPDSVSVSAQDAEADQLLGIIKSAGLGLFGGDDAGHSHTGQPMTVDVDGGEGPQANIEVVDDHDDMLSLIRKMTGQGPAQANGDYEEEGGHEEHGHSEGEEETCESCGGMMEEGHSCGEAVEEDESMDQREYEVAEDQSGGDDSEESDEVNSDATRDAALATAAGKNFANTDAPLEEGGDGGEASDAGADGVDIADVAEEDLEESLANGADDTFESDIDFMTKVISGGLNKQKSTGQTTIPVVSTQVNRLGNPMRESTDLLHDWRKLSGIK